MSAPPRACRTDCPIASSTYPDCWRAARQTRRSPSCSTSPCAPCTTTSRTSSTSSACTAARLRRYISSAQDEKAADRLALVEEVRRSLDGAHARGTKLLVREQIHLDVRQVSQAAARRRHGVLLILKPGAESQDVLVAVVGGLI